MTSNLSIPLIDKLISKRNFVLHSWDDNYSTGVWCCCLPYSGQCIEVEDASEDQGFDMDSAYSYFLDPNANWLPIVIAPSFIEALAALEARLAALPPDFISTDSWSYATFQVIEHVRTVRKKTSENYAETNGKYKPLPTDFNDIDAYLSK